MCPHDSKPEPGEMVLLKSIPPGLVDGLPQDDQNAIVAIIGKPVLRRRFVGHGELREKCVLASLQVIHLGLELGTSVARLDRIDDFLDVSFGAPKITLRGTEARPPARSKRFPKAKHSHLASLRNPSG